MVEIMCGGYTGEHDAMRQAVIRAVPNWTDDSRGPDVFRMVDLYKGDQLFGTIDVTPHSKYYADDVVENWVNGILREDNEYITKPE